MEHSINTAESISDHVALLWVVADLLHIERIGKFTSMTDLPSFFCQNIKLRKEWAETHANLGFLKYGTKTNEKLISFEALMYYAYEATDDHVKFSMAIKLALRFIRD